MTADISGLAKCPSPPQTHVVHTPHALWEPGVARERVTCGNQARALPFILCSQHAAEQ